MYEIETIGDLAPGLSQIPVNPFEQWLAIPGTPGTPNQAPQIPSLQAQSPAPRSSSPDLPMLALAFGAGALITFLVLRR